MLDQSMTEEKTIAFPQDFWICDPEHPERIDWRKCKFSILISEECVEFHAHVQNKPGGQEVHLGLFRNVGFEAALDFALEGILADCLEHYDKFSIYDVPRSNDWRQFPVKNALSKGNANPASVEDPALLYFKLHSFFFERLQGLTPHQEMELHVAARKMANSLNTKRLRSAQPD